MKSTSASRTTGYRVHLFYNKLVLLAGLGFFLHCSAVAQLVISPTTLELSQTQKIAAVSVTMDSKALVPMRLQASVFSWRQDSKGENVNEPTTELLVNPLIAEIKPGQKQIFRVALSGQRTVQEELAYRLVLEDISPAIAPAQGTNNLMIDFRVRYDLPVLSAPIGPVINRLVWKPCASDSSTSTKASEACVHLLNTGNRRVKVQSLTIEGDTWQQTRDFGAGENILAGAERELTISLKPGQSSSFRKVQVQTALGETLQIDPGNFSR